jgi:glycosyltransferase involved in cell wall biosynthesis
VKKIIFCVTNDLSNDQRMIKICNSLFKAGYQVELVGRKLPFSKSLKERGFQQKRLFCFFQKGKLFYIEYNIRLFFYLLFQKTDAICAIDLDTILPVLGVTKIRSKIAIYDAHEYFTEVPEVIRRPKIKQFWEFVAEFAIPKFKHCYTVGSALAKLFSERYHVDFEVIRSIAMKNENLDLQSETKSEKLILLYQGALNEGRGIEFAIDSMQYLDGFELWIAGEGDLSQQLRNMTFEKKLNDKVKFLGMLSPEDLHQLTPKATLGIQFSENLGLSYYYSLANKTFDYIHAEVPAIHPDFPEYRVIIDKYGCGEILKSYQPNEIAAQIRAMVSNKEKYQKMREGCKAAQTEFCWENEEIKLLKFYKYLF